MADPMAALPDGFQIDSGPPPPPPGFTVDASKMSTGRDVLRSAATGLVEGAAAIPSMFGNIVDTTMSLPAYGLAYLLEKTGQVKPGFFDAVRKPLPAAPEMGMEGLGPMILHYAGGAHTPQTTAGEYARTAGQFAPAAVAFGANSVSDIPGALVKYGALPAVASETAGQMTKGTPYEPYARVGGALAGSIPGAVWDWRSGATTDALRSAISEVTPAQVDQARALMQDARQRGTNVTLPEAIAQVTGGKVDLTDIQRVLEKSRGGQPVMSPVMAERAPGNAAAMQDELGNITPPVANPYDVAPQVQKVGEDAIQRAATARTAAVTPLYKSAATDQVPAATVEDVLKRIDGMVSADKTGILSGPLGELRDTLTAQQATAGVAPQRIAQPTPAGGTIYKVIPGQAPQPRVPVTDIENLDRARKFFRDQTELPAFAEKAVDKETGGKITGLLGGLDTAMENASGDYLAGKKLYQQITEKTNAPLERSPLGQLADAGTFDKQAQILFSPKPLPGSEMAISGAVSQVARANPQAARDLVRMKLEQDFNSIAKDAPSGAARFVDRLTADPQRAKNLEAAVRALPNGGNAWDSMRKLFDIFDAQGYRQSPGSQTEFNRQISDAFRSGGPLGETAALVTSPGKWTTAVMDAYRDFKYGKNTEQWAQLFTNPDFMAEMNKLRIYPSRSPVAFEKAAGLIAQRAPGLLASQQVNQP